MKQHHAQVATQSAGQLLVFDGTYRNCTDDAAGDVLFRLIASEAYGCRWMRMPRQLGLHI